MARFSRERILELLEALNDELRKRGTRGALYMAGGAVMCLAFEARDSTKDIDADLQPTSEILDAALKVADREGLPETWLNNAVKGFLSDHGSYEKFREMSNLTVFAAQAEYMLAMKCLAMRMGEGFHDEADIRYLVRYLEIRKYQDALGVIRKFYPLEKYPKTALAVLRELTDRQPSS